MNTEELKKLRTGEKIRHKASGQVYEVNKTKPEVIATRAIAVVNPMDWEVIEPTDQDSTAKRFSLEGQSVYDAHAKKAMKCEDLVTAQKMLGLLQSGEVTANQFDWTDIPSK